MHAGELAGKKAMDEGSRIYLPRDNLPRMGRYDQMVCPQICSTDVNV
jgi:hypothetical protein